MSQQRLPGFSPSLSVLHLFSGISIRRLSGAATRAGAIYAGSMAISGGNVTIQKSTAKESIQKSTAKGGKGGRGVRVAILGPETWDGSLHDKTTAG